jgi:PBP1b-binding outer membrane lipoprotein LpoB
MKFLYFFVILTLFLNGCSKIRESAGVTRQSSDEYQVFENPPLIIPPEFNLVSPDQLQGKNIDKVDSELAKEILFGLDNDKFQNVNEESVIGKILEEANASEASESIRKEIDEGIAKEINTKDLTLDNWEDEIQVLNAINESECIRNKNFEKDSILDCENSIIIEIKNKKKKKRFFFF